MCICVPVYATRRFVLLELSPSWGDHWPIIIKKNFPILTDNYISICPYRNLLSRSVPSTYHWWARPGEMKNMKFGHSVHQRGLVAVLWYSLGGHGQTLFPNISRITPLQRSTIMTTKARAYRSALCLFVFIVPSCRCSSTWIGVRQGLLLLLPDSLT